MQDLWRLRVTPALCLAMLWTWFQAGPLTDASQLQNFQDSLGAIIRHGSLSHILVNLGLIAVAGTLTERDIGALRTAILALACAGLGSLAQYLVTGPDFLGMSAVAYGFLAYAILHTTPKDKLAQTWALILMFLGMEAWFQADQIAIYTHITSILIGGGYAMFGSLFGSKEPVLKPMQLTHLAAALAIIDETDDDDAREAEASLRDEGLEGMFVLLHRGQVIGLTGYDLDEQVPDIAWLSWTYLTKSYAGEGYGSQMMNNLLGKLKDQGVRKLFIATSDYDDFGKQLYADAHRMYEDFGAEVELKIPQFHGTREAKIIYGLNNPEFVPGPAEPASVKNGLRIRDGAFEAESDRVMGLVWRETDEGLSGMEEALQDARRQYAKQVSLAVPSDLSEANTAALMSHGFEKVGQLKDYYSPGLHQDWWICSFTNK